MTDVQHAAFSKRLFAFLADVVIAGLLVTGIFLLLWTVFDVDRYKDVYGEVKASYEKEYGVTFGMNAEDFGKLDKDAQDNYTKAVDAMNADERANNALKTYLIYALSILAGGALISGLLLEFLVPLLFKDGRTLGKKLFGLGVMRTGMLRVKAPVLFVRGVIGKAVFELLLPAVMTATALMGVTGIFGFIMVGVFGIAEIVALVKTGGQCFLHDVLADTYVIDWSSQPIFDTAEERDTFLAEREAARKAAEEENEAFY
ncbi:MAG: RDD family protein [Clostridia bacterium]|nr:RDD family protein [Clostridia bacterium]